MNYKKPSSLIQLALISSLTLGSLAGCATSSSKARDPDPERTQKLAKLGDEGFAEIKKEEKLATDAAEKAYVSCISKQIISQLPAPWNQQSDWDIQVFENKKVNAFALPGNNIGVYRGMIRRAENQHQLAAVIGHELAHVIAGHSDAKLRTWSLINYGVSIAKTQGGEKAAKEVEKAAKILIALPNSRVNENEADLLGQEYMAQAGFDPKQSVQLWQVMQDAKDNGKETPELLSTHPTDGKRMASLKQHLEKRSNSLYEKALQQGLSAHCRKPE